MSLAKQLQEFDTKPSMLLIYAIAVALFDFILMGLQTFHEFLYALIARQIAFNFKKLMWCSFIIFVPYPSSRAYIIGGSPARYPDISIDYKINFWQYMSVMSFGIDSNHQFSSSLTNSFNEFILTSRLPPAFLNEEIFSLSSSLQCNLPNGIAGNSDITDPIIDVNCRIIGAGLLKKLLIFKIRCSALALRSGHIFESIKNPGNLIF